jgi:hypothetical protein
MRQSRSTSSRARLIALRSSATHGSPLSIRTTLMPRAGLPIASRGNHVGHRHHSSGRSESSALPESRGPRSAAVGVAACGGRDGMSRIRRLATMCGGPLLQHGHHRAGKSGMTPHHRIRQFPAVAPNAGFAQHCRRSRDDDGATGLEPFLPRVAASGHPPDPASAGRLPTQLGRISVFRGPRAGVLSAQSSVEFPPPRRVNAWARRRPREAAFAESSDNRALTRATRVCVLPVPGLAPRR